jgi:myo-inositol-1(or 4)-monophosphatase
MPDSKILSRIQAALQAASLVASKFTPGAVEFKFKTGDDPVTAADHAINDVLREMLVCTGEGWLSEETTDDLARVSKKRLWVVDPLDGTREFVAGIPEWCISVGLVEDGEAVAGGICNPCTGEMIVGSRTSGVTYNGKPVRVSSRQDLAGAVVLGSRSESKRGEWDRFQNGSFTVRPMGSVAYKLGLVAAGLADATWTLVPKHEWDVAGGTALVQAAGGIVRTLDNVPVRFNSANPKLCGLVVSGPALYQEISTMLGLPAVTTSGETC